MKKHKMANDLIEFKVAEKRPEPIVKEVLRGETLLTRLLVCGPLPASCWLVFPGLWGERLMRLARICGQGARRRP
jgi:hypothetical protein